MKRVGVGGFQIDSYQEKSTLKNPSLIRVKDFFGKCDQIHRKLWNWLHLRKKFLMEN